MEVVRNVAGERYHILVFIELTHADAALLHRFEILSVVPCFDDAIDHAITLVLLLIDCVEVFLRSSDDTGETADANTAADSDNYGRSHRQKQQN